MYSQESCRDIEERVLFIGQENPRQVPYCFEEENLKLSKVSLLQLNMNAEIFEESVASFHNHNSIEIRYFLSACTSRQEELPKISGTQYGWGTAE